MIDTSEIKRNLTIIRNSKLFDEDAGDAEEFLLAITDKKAIPIFIKALTDKKDSVRRVVADCLEKIGDKSAVDAICKAIETEKDVYVRSSLVGAIGSIGGADALKCLRSVLIDDEYYLVNDIDIEDDSDIRGNAAEDIIRLGGDKLTQPFIDALESSNPEVVETCKIILGKNKDDDLIDDLDWICSDEHAEFPDKCLGILIDIGTPSAVCKVIDIFDETDQDDWCIFFEESLDWQQKDLFRLLEKSSIAETSQLLVEILVNDYLDDDIRILAVESLGRKGLKKNSKPMIKILNDEMEDSILRRLTATALGLIGGDPVKKALKKIVSKNDGGKLLKRATQKALDNIETL